MTALRDREFSDDEPVLVSICSITFNHAPYIAACLDGFLEQECDGRIEIVIHDDASTDGTADIIRAYAEKHPTIIRPVLQTENQYSRGVNPYYAFVLPAARGKYIAICDGDDYWSDPTKLQRQTDVLEAQKDIAITYGPVQAITEGDVPTPHQAGATRDLSAQELKSTRGLNTLTTCFRNVFRDQGPPAFLRHSPIGDLTLWAMLGYHGRGHYMTDLPPANYRMHDGGILSQQSAGRQNFMTATAHLLIAAYHYEAGDKAACRTSATVVLRALVRIGVYKVATLAKFAVKAARSPQL